MISGRLQVRDRILRDNTAIVLHLNFELIVRQDALTQFQDLRERAGVEPVIDVLADVRLEHDGFALPDQPPAIDEVFHDMTHFRDVSVGRDGIAVGQNEMRKRVRMLFENDAEIGEFHARLLYSYIGI